MISQPSERFAIADSSWSTSTGRHHLSYAGKDVISSEMNKVCDCLSVALAVEVDKEISSKLSKKLSRWIQPSFDDNEDTDFLSKVARRFASEISFLSKNYSNCLEFIVNNADDLLFTFLNSLLDSSRLEQFPSRNLQRIQESTGEIGLEEAVKLLDILNDDSLQDIRDLQWKRKQKLEEIWEFHSNLGKVFTENTLQVSSCSSIKVIGESLLNFDSNLPQSRIPTSDTISLESEGFKSFRLLRNIISLVSRTEDTDLSLERIASCLVLHLSNQVLRIMESLTYYDRSMSGSSSSKKTCFKRARLTELLFTFIELFSACTAWILRESGCQRSENWSIFQRLIRDKLISPILRKDQKIDSTCALQEITTAANCILRRTPIPSFSLPKHPGVLSCLKDLDEELFNGIFRRSTQLFIATAFNEDVSSLQNAILEAVMNSSDEKEDFISRFAGKSFPSSRHHLSSNLAWPYESPLQRDIDDYLSVVEEETKQSTTPEWRLSLTRMKTSFLSTYILPRLIHKILDLGKKRKLVKFLSNILECHVYCEATSELNGFLDRSAIRSMVKAITLTLNQCLIQPVVDDDLARSLFVCSMNMANVSFLVDGGHSSSLITWSRNKMQETAGKSMIELSSAEIDGSYVWIFFQWLHSLGSLLVGTNDGADQDLLSYRLHCLETMDCKTGVMNDDPLDLDDAAKDLFGYEKLLIDFEDFLFPARKENVSNIVNVYAKSSNPNWSNKNGCSSTDVSLEPWRPSAGARRRSKEFMAVVVAML
jgi:hypothetical protein